jgi:hypothetical protein
MTYLEMLSRELSAVGIGGRRRKRILAELADHLTCDSAAELGEPVQLARQFADELGTNLSRRAAFVVFAALALVGVLFGVAFLTHPGLLSSASDTSRPLSDLAAALIVIGPQVAFVAGLLGAVRAARRRRTTVLARAEAGIIVRRAAIGLLGGLGSMIGFALTAFILRDRAPAWWVVATLGMCGAGVVALLAAAPSVVRAARLRPVTGGPGGDLFDDLGPVIPSRLRGKPWSLALLVAGALAVVIAFAGALQSDPFDGLLRGFADGAACLIGYAALGRYLGLRG